MSEQGNGQQEKDWRNEEPNLNPDKYYFQIAAGIIITLIVLLIGGAIYSKPDSGYWVNIYASVVGTILTISVLDRRAEQRASRERKEELILQMGSPADGGFAIEALRVLTQKKWLKNGILVKSYLAGANLPRAYLVKVNLREAILTQANLQGADLSSANLQKAELTGVNLKNAGLVLTDFQEAILRVAKLQQAELIEANLQKAFLADANLREVNLTNANLRGAWLMGSNLLKAKMFNVDLQDADLREANLQGVWLMGSNLVKANLRDANLQDAMLGSNEFSSETILPNGEYWTSDSDMKRFTDQKHPNFWRSSNNFSPASPRNPYTSYNPQPRTRKMATDRFYRPFFG